MSARQVKKIISKAHVESKDESSEDSLDEPKSVSKNRFGTFDLSEEEEDEEEKEENEEIEEKEVFVEPVTSQVTTKINSKKKTKKKVDKIEEYFDELPVEEEKKNLIMESCLKRDSKFFDSENELQKLFQEKRVKSKARSRQKSFLLTPSLVKQQNMKIGYLPTMEKQDNLFYFEMSKGYLKLHSDYLFCVESNDPGLLHEFSFKYPFHIETLYQMVLFYKLQAKYEQVYQFLERILFAFQLAFHHQFSPIGRDVQMNIAGSALTRIFFKSIFLFIDCLGRKGCYRTALEFSKLLLSLDYRDPLGALFLIDYYSLSTRNYEYFIYFSSTFMKEFLNKQKTLNLPSSLYSLSLAKAFLTNNFAVTQKDVDRAFELNSLETLHTESSSVILLCAIGSYPLIAKLLLQRLSPSFNFVYEEGIDWDYELITNIFVTRTLDLWRAESVVSWLKQAADESEIVGIKNFDDIWVYESLQAEDFSFTSRNLIPQDMAFK